MIRDGAIDDTQHLAHHGRRSGLLASARLELGDLEAARACAQEGVAFIRDSNARMNLHSYAVLARAQLALTEPAADITGILDEYEGLLTRTHR